MRAARTYSYGGPIVNRTYCKHKTLYIYLFLLTIFGPINYAPHVIVNKEAPGCLAQRGHPPLWLLVLKLVICYVMPM